MSGKFSVPKMVNAVTVEQPTDPYQQFAYMIHDTEPPSDDENAALHQEYCVRVAETFARGNVAAHRASTDGYPNCRHCVMKDSGATVNLVNKLSTLRNVYRLEHPIQLSTVGNPVSIMFAGE